MDEPQHEELQPGQVISPRSPAESVPPQPATTPPEPEAPSGPDDEPLPAPSPTPGPETIDPAPIVPPMPLAGEAEWAYRNEPDAASATLSPTLPADELSWTATEFIAHDKNAAWYGWLAAAGVGVAAIDYLVTRDLFSTFVILVAALLFGVFAARKPSEQQYGLDPRGIHVGQKSYDLHTFKTFAIAHEEGVVSIVLMPLKRFMPPLTLYVTPEVESQVVGFLSAFMPVEPHKPDAVDGLLRRIRF